MLVAGPAAAQGPDRINLPDGWQPEGITSSGGPFVFVSSLAQGGIWRGNVRSGTGAVLVKQQRDRQSVGLDLEVAHDRLWAAGGQTGQVRVFDARTGQELRTYQQQTGFLNDITVTPAGAFATDSNNPQLVFVPLGPGGGLATEDEVRLIPLTGDIRYADGFNANGIVSAGGWLIIVQTNTGRLFRVDPASGTTFAIDTGDVDLTGGDGLELHGNLLYVVRGTVGKVEVLELDALLSHAGLLTELSSPSLDSPSTITLADDQLFVVNARFGVQGASDVPYWLTRLPLRP